MRIISTMLLYPHINAAKTGYYIKSNKPESSMRPIRMNHAEEEPPL